MQQKLFYSELNDEFNCTQKLVTHISLKSFSWIALPHPDACHICIFSQMAKNLQSLPNLFYILFGPSLTKMNQEGLFHSNHLPLILRVPAISYSPTRKKMLHCLCTATSETQFCYYETPTLKQGFGETIVLNCITSSWWYHPYFNPIVTKMSFIIAQTQGLHFRTLLSLAFLLIWYLH